MNAPATRALASFLIVPLALLGAVVDLCACSGGEHGARCAAATSAAPDGTPGAGGCCSGGASALRDAVRPDLEAEQRADAAGAAQGPACASPCGCPSAQLTVSAAERDGARVLAPTAVAAGAATPLDLDRLPQAARRRAGSLGRPPPDGPRRHLVLSVFLL